MARASRAPTASSIAEAFEAIVDNVETVIAGKDDVVRLSLVTLMAQGHLLIEDVPGVGKTMLAKAVAKSTSCDYKRIQFTPDLLPTDVTGVSVYNSKTKSFHFNPGPLFANIVLGDEINRAPPKTQSALLESMEEQQVTVDGATHKMGHPFMVIATQNPIEHEGTYPLPESQLDRFMTQVTIGYPSRKHSLDILETHGTSEPIDDLKPVIDPAGVQHLIAAAKKVHAADSIREYIIDLIEATRSHQGIQLGASPRASLFLLRASRALACSQGRDFVLPDDVKTLAPSVLSHRVIASVDSRIDGLDARQLVTAITKSVSAPRG